MTTLWKALMHLNPLNSWSLRFILDHAGPMTLGSAVRYRNFVLGDAEDQERPDILRFRMRRSIRGDVWLRARGSDMAGLREIVYEGVYDAVKERIRSAKYVIDLGGNVGLAARYFATCYRDCRILVVEPHPDNYTLLEKNVAQLVKVGRCRILRAAVWGRKATLALAPLPGKHRHLEASVYETQVADAPLVEAVTMPELIELSGFPVVDMLKVDIEGAEVGLFSGDSSWLERVRSIAIEFHGDSRERSGFDDVMKQNGFEVDDTHRHTVLATNCSHKK